MELVSGRGDHPKEAGPTETEAAETLLGPMGSRGLGENEASVAFLSKDALGLRFFPLAQFIFAEYSFPKRGLCHI